MMNWTLFGIVIGFVIFSLIIIFIVIYCCLSKKFIKPIKDDIERNKANRSSFDESSDLTNSIELPSDVRDKLNHLDPQLSAKIEKVIKAKVTEVLMESYGFPTSNDNNELKTNDNNNKTSHQKPKLTIIRSKSIENNNENSNNDDIKIDIETRGNNINGEPTPRTLEEEYKLRSMQQISYYIDKEIDTKSIEIIYENESENGISPTIDITGITPENIKSAFKSVMKSDIGSENMDEIIVNEILSNENFV